MIGTIVNPHGETLDYTFHEGAANARDVLVVGHGVTGNKDRPFVVALAEAVAAEGVSVLRFSFAGNGGSGGRFGDCTISKEVEDLKAVLRSVEAQGLRATYAGHSMGGAVGVHEVSASLSYALIGLHVTAALLSRLKGEGVWSAMVPVWREG